MAVLRKQRISAIAPRLSLIGRLYKGTPKQKNAAGKEIQGKDLDYFRFEPEESLKSFAPTEAGYNSLYDELRARWDSLRSDFADYKQIAIFLPFSTVEANFSYSNEKWATKGGKQQCLQRCDGETMSQWTQDGVGVVRGRKPCQMKDSDRECPIGCKASGYLSVLIPALRYPGTVQLTTHSGNDIRNILGGLGFYESRGFDLSKIPMRLCRSMRSCDWHKEDGSIVPQKKPLVHIEVDPAFGVGVLEAQSEQYQAKMLGTAAPTALPSAAPAALLPASDHFSNSMAWFEFQNAVRGALNKNDVELLNEIEAEALNSFPSGAESSIRHFVAEARSLIVASGNIAPRSDALRSQKPAPPATEPKPAKSKKSAAVNPNTARIRTLATATGHTPDQMRELARAAKLPASSVDYTADQAAKLCDAILIDWAVGAGLSRERAIELMSSGDVAGGYDDESRLDILMMAVDEAAEMAGGLDDDLYADDDEPITAADNTTEAIDVEVSTVVDQGAFDPDDNPFN